MYVADRYEGIEAKTFAHCSDAEIAAYVQANVDAVREVTERVRPDVALANHLVMGPVILARALAGETPYAVKVHGSALEYTVKPEPERFLGVRARGAGVREDGACRLQAYRRESLASARGTRAPSSSGTRLGPPGVDVERFVPRDRSGRGRCIRSELDRLRRSAAASPRGAVERICAR